MRGSLEPISKLHICTSGTVLESWLFGYDGDGSRVSTAHFVGGTAEALTLYFLDGAYETRSDPSAGSGQSGTIRKYYALAGQTIAVFNLTPEHLTRSRTSSLTMLRQGFGTVSIHSTRRLNLPQGKVDWPKPTPTTAP